MNFAARLIRGLLVFSYLLTLTRDSDCLADETPTGLTEGEKRGGWKLLFDGKTSNGWRSFRAEKLGDGWAVKDGVLERVSNGAGDIVTTDEFEHFELSMEYRISKLSSRNHRLGI